jgi:hypothetical protein
MKIQANLPSDIEIEVDTEDDSVLVSTGGIGYQTYGECAWKEFEDAFKGLQAARRVDLSKDVTNA